MTFMSEAKLKKEIERKIRTLRVQENKCHTSRGRDWYLPYLEAVFRYRRKIQKCSAEEQRVIRRVLNSHRLEELVNVKKRSPFRRILDATTKSPASTRSRWTLGLKYINAKREKVKNVGFAEFVTSSGGIAGCERLWRDLQPKKKKQKVKPKTGVGSRSISMNNNSADDENDDW